MVDVVITIKIMPEAPESDLSLIEKESRKYIERFNGYISEVKKEPVAFGLKSVNITFALDESKSMDELEDLIRNIEGVQSVDVISVTRAVG